MSPSEPVCEKGRARVSRALGELGFAVSIAGHGGVRKRDSAGIRAVFVRGLPSRPSHGSVAPVLSGILPPCPTESALPRGAGERGVLLPFLKVKEISSSFPGVKLRFHVSVLMEKVKISLEKIKCEELFFSIF